MSTLAKFTSARAVKSINGLFSETTAPMVLKFHMQHKPTSGLQNDKIQGARESMMAANTRNS